MAAQESNADLVLMDVGPNLGAINRAALIAANYVMIPLAPDLFSLQGLNNLGPALRRWRGDWRKRLDAAPDPKLSLPPGDIRPLGYVVLQHGVRTSRPVKAYQRWIDRIPETYRTAVLGESGVENPPPALSDPYCLAMLKHYRSLMPLAMEGANRCFTSHPQTAQSGPHVAAVRDCFNDFSLLAQKVAKGIDISFR